MSEHKHETPFGIGAALLDSMTRRIHDRPVKQVGIHPPLPDPPMASTG